MAGSPGAGKTEISKTFISIVEKEVNKRSKNNDFKIVRIDADEIRDLLPGYTGNNSDLFQGAISKGMHILVNHCIDKKLNMLVDGTFSSNNSFENVKRSIKHGRLPYIIYVYQDPVKAWELTRAREMREGISVPLLAFIESLFSAKDNVNKVKEFFGNKVYVDYVERDFEKDVSRYEINIKNIDNYLEIKYDRESLRKILSD